MRRLSRIAVSVSIATASLATPLVAHGAPDGRGGYIVERGDSLFGIAREQGVAIHDLLGANGLALSSVIHPGQRLLLPTAATRPAVDAGSNAGTYTVRAGDSLWGISRHLDIPLTSLLTANSLNVASVIHPGRVLRVPASSPTSPPTTAPPPRSAGATGTYVVRAGDSLWGISRRLGVGLPALLRANALTATSLILPGRTLVVPAAATTPPPATSTAPTAPTSPSPATPSPVAGTTSTVEAEQIIREIWPDHLEQQAVDIARRESGLRAAAQSECCVGLFQLYYDVHSTSLAAMGITSRSALLDARANARAALSLYQMAGWQPWAVTSAT